MKNQSTTSLASGVTMGSKKSLAAGAENERNQPQPLHAV